MLNRRKFMHCAAAAVAGSVLTSQGTPQTPVHKKARAKAVIQIWMWGGSSQLDTFDPKPEAGDEYCGPLKNPVETNVKGIRISEQLPLLAKQADKYSIIRSLTHGVNAHETASFLVQTGRQVDSMRAYPAIGSVVAMLKGANRSSSIPPYVVLTTSQGRFSKAGFLGSEYKPFITGGDPAKDPFLVQGYVVEGVDRERQMKRRRMLESLDTFDAGSRHSREVEQSLGGAYRQILGDDQKVFDLSLEKDKVREAYGRNWFGQSCLAARRLVENGVPWVTINYPGWDTHKRHFQILERAHPEMDRGMASLLQDLSASGLLDQTVVWWGGEFGRTPRIAWGAPWNGGRGHWGQCFNGVVAGGGFKGGSVVGSSNTVGEEVAERPVYPQDLLGSIYELLGIDPDAKMPNPENIDLPIMARASEYGRLHEIM